MSTEERDVPPLDTILADLDPMQQRLDQHVKEGTFNAGVWLQNELMPLIKDFVESTLFGFEDIQDQIAPVEIPAAEAESIVEILEATKASNAGNKLLADRIDRALAHLKPEIVGGDDEDEDEDEEKN
jgi:hypothetical protein